MREGIYSSIKLVAGNEFLLHLFGRKDLIKHSPTNENVGEKGFDRGEGGGYRV